MRREFSAGGVLVRRLDGRWQMAAIRPAGKREGTWALPKGRIDPGERGEETALREVAEETGAHGRSLGKLGDVRYWFNWEGERIFKVVSFFLVRYTGGRLGDVPEEFRHEVAEVRWLPLDEAPALLAYPGEREMARKAQERLAELAGDVVSGDSG
jgi:8-oxo-dGTP pyrophosphatase MutT (NUDIX family)